MSEPPGSGSPRGGSWFAPLKTAGAFVFTLFQLQRKVDGLREKTTELHQQIARLQRQVDEQAGQIAIIREFITTAIHQTAARSGEEAAKRAIRALLEDRRDQDS